MTHQVTNESQSPGLGTALLSRARNAIAGALNLPVEDESDHPALGEPGATFVTLSKADQLRGCIGSLVAHRALDRDVRANAVAAAFSDLRFAPVQQEEWQSLTVEVSLLAPPMPIIFCDETDALRQLRPHIDGVIFEYGSQRSTFLPQVWESLSDPVEFLAQLKRKAGLPADFWAAGVKLSRYEVQKWKAD